MSNDQYAEISDLYKGANMNNEVIAKLRQLVDEKIAEERNSAALTGADYGGGTTYAETETIDGIQYVLTAYDFIDNGNGQLMMVMDKPEGIADDDNAKLIHNPQGETRLIRGSAQIVRMPVIPQEVREMLGKLKEILVTEMDGNDIDDTYMAKVEVINKPLPIPREVDY